MSKHAYLSASSSHRWLSCPPSARLCAETPDQTSPYAKEGTDAHTLCEYKILTALGKKLTDPIPNLDYYSQEMENCATEYCSYVMEQLEAIRQNCPDPQIMVEQRLDFSRWVPDGFGTGDCIIVADDILHVIDYKHCLGILVEADHNPQMMCYALGALELFDGIYDISTIRMTIFQQDAKMAALTNIPKKNCFPRQTIHWHPLPLLP